MIGILARGQWNPVRLLCEPMGARSEVHFYSPSISIFFLDLLAIIHLFHYCPSCINLTARNWGEKNQFQPFLNRTQPCFKTVVSCEWAPFPWYVPIGVTLLNNFAWVGSIHNNCDSIATITAHVGWAQRWSEKWQKGPAVERSMKWLFSVFWYEMSYRMRESKRMYPYSRYDCDLGHMNRIGRWWWKQVAEKHKTK